MLFFLFLFKKVFLVLRVAPIVKTAKEAKIRTRKFLREKYQETKQEPELPIKLTERRTLGFLIHSLLAHVVECATSTPNGTLNATELTRLDSIESSGYNPAGLS